MRVLHVITGLNLGGAEVMLHRLLRASARAGDVREVISLTDLGIVAERIEALGVPARALRMTRMPNPASVVRLARLVDRFRPDVVQTWMYHADLVGGLAARLARRGRVVWGLHNSTLDRERTRRTTRWVVAASARLSRRVPDAIVSVSGAARDLHVAAGYDARKFEVIPNGFDLAEHRIVPAWRTEVRAELGVPDAAVLVGLVARVDPQKDHLNFVRAAALLSRRAPGARFLLCGEGATAANRELAGAIAQAGVADRFHLLGRRADVPRILNALDVASLSSAYGEAFPLVIGEAMACGVPAVVTDLGDCAELVGETGRVVPPRDPEALAAAWEALVEAGPDGRRRLGLAARERIAGRYGLDRIAAQYDALYRRVLGAEPVPLLPPRAAGGGSGAGS
jgi:glycosyltransferase involved in cell wall biosynthesis